MAAMAAAGWCSGIHKWKSRRITGVKVTLGRGAVAGQEEAKQDGGISKEGSHKEEGRGQRHKGKGEGGRAVSQPSERRITAWSSLV